jgi:hypothetical protein
MKEAYEEVKVKDIKVGDIIKYGAWPPGEWKQWNADDFRINCLENATLVRQLPPERNPDVLLRALGLAVEYMSGDDKAAQLEVVKEFIEDAIREMESEAGR